MDTIIILYLFYKPIKQVKMTPVEIYNRYCKYINILGFMAFAVSAFYGYVQYITINLLGFLYLMYDTIEFLDYPGESINQYSRSCALLRWWACYGTYIIMEPVGDFIFKFLPFPSIYNIAKIVLLLWVIRSANNYESLYNFLVKNGYYQIRNPMEKLSVTMERGIMLYRTTFNHYMGGMFGRNTQPPQPPQPYQPLKPRQSSQPTSKQD